MISLHTEQLSKAEQLELKRLFVSPGFKILLQVIESNGKEHVCEAANEALKADEYSAKFEPASIALCKAQSCHRTIQLLTDLSTQESHKVVKLA